MAQASFTDFLQIIRWTCAGRGPCELTDKELLERYLANRDEDAFAHLVKRHGPMVLGVSRRVLGDSQDVQDVFQATFLVLIRRMGSIRRKQSVGSWLYGVAQRLALRVQRQEAVRRCREREASQMRSEQARDELSLQELRSVLDEEMARLPEKYRAPLVLCHLEGCSYEQAARQLGCPKTTVAKRVHRACKVLRRNLERRGVTLTIAALTTTLAGIGSAAPLPAMLTIKTIKAGTLVVAGKSVVGCMSAGAVALAEEAVAGMLGINGKAVLVSLVFGLMALGAGLAANGGFAKKADHVGRTFGAIIGPAKMADDPASAVAANKDLYGDPLPPGAVKRLGTLRQRMPAASFAVTADGKEIVAVNDMAAVRRFDALTGRLRAIHQLPRADHRLVDTWVSPRGTYVLACDVAAGASQLELWELNQGKRTQTLSVGQVSIRQVAFSADESLAAFVHFTPANSLRHEVMIWDLKSSKSRILSAEIDNRAGGPYPSPVLAISPRGDSLAALFPDNTLRCWDVQGGKLRWQAKAKGNAALFFSADGQRLVSATEGKNMVLEWWNAHSGKSLDAKNNPPTKAARLIGFLPRGSLLAFQTGAREIVTWDPASGKTALHLPAARSWEAGAQMKNAFVFTPDGTGLIRRADGLQRFDLTTGKAVYPDTQAWGHTAAVLRVVFSPDGTLMASSSVDQTARVWAVATARPLQNFPKDRTYHLAFSPDGRCLFARPQGSDDLGLRQWDVATGRAKQDYKLPDHPGPYPFFYSKENLQLTPDGKKILMTNVRWDQEHTTWLTTWDAQSAKCLENRQVPWSEDSVLTPDSKGTLTFNRRTRVIEIVDIATGKPRLQFATERLPFEDLVGCHLTLSASGRLMAARIAFLGDAKIIDDQVQIGDMRSGRQIMKLSIPRTIANMKDSGDYFAFSTDDRLFAAITPQGIRLWEIASGQEIGTLRDSSPAFARETFSIAFSPDNRILASGHADSTILLWDATLRNGARGGQLTPAQAEKHWPELTSDHASRVNAIFWALVDDPQQAVLLLKKHLEPAMAPRPEVTQALLRDLDSDSFKLRERATKKLEDLGELAEPALRAALKVKPSLETQRRIQTLLDKLAASGPLKGDALRGVRAVQILERFATADARAILERLGQGLESARLTRTAKDSLARLVKH